MSTRKSLRSPRAVRKERRKRARAALRLSALFAALLAVSLYALLRPEFLLREIRVEGGDAALRERVSAYAREYLAGSYWGVLPKANAFLYPKRSLETALLGAFPSLAATRFSREWPAALRIEALLRKEAAVWCAGEACFLMDETGVVFAPASAEAVSKVRHRLIDASGIQPALGERPLDSSRLASFLSLFRGLSALGAEAGEIRLLGDGELVAELRGGARLLLREEPSFGKTLSRLAALLSEKNLVPRTGDGGIDVAYLDLRYGNKIYFKLNGR